ncbi:MAG: cobalt-precorrin-5B (C(1))-methyltransferase [Moorea sp. SIO2B7]|nr:cobalt-precorrin-5B (C(1))-methyltransferase [Moorena sp. SIO2B7]
MNICQPRPGYTLPVFACAAAVAALQCLRQGQQVNTVSVDLIEPAQRVEIPIEQVAIIKKGMALAITRSDPGDNLDLTRNTPIWALVELREKDRNEEDAETISSSLSKRWEDISELESEQQIILKGGEGIGRQVNNEGKAAIYNYAEKLLRCNLKSNLKPKEKITVTIILPEGRRLAERTSNAAFGVIEGLSLLGTTGISQPLSAPGQLDAYRQELAVKAAKFDCLVFCVGENGLDLARNLGINPEQLVKTANWLGPLLVEAGLQQIQSILLFGYHGKLIKLAGGIFHTHHHLADGRLEILTAHCAQLGLPTLILQQIFASPTTEVALKILRALDAEDGSNWVNQVYSAIASTIDRRCQDYIRKHSEREVCVGSILFDRDRNIIIESDNSTTAVSRLKM